MPDYTIETTYHLPVYRHRTYVADTPEAACRAAIEDDDWEHGKRDYESAGETYITGIWQGRDTAYAGAAVRVPAHFDETAQRQAGHFEILLGVLKILVTDARAGQRTPDDWIARAAWAVARAEAILAGARDPDESAPMPAPSHVLATLSEDRVRHHVTVILATERGHGGLLADAVSDADIHTACRAIAAANTLARDVAAAEITAAMQAIEATKRRRLSNGLGPASTPTVSGIERERGAGMRRAGRVERERPRLALHHSEIHTMTESNLPGAATPLPAPTPPSYENLATAHDALSARVRAQNKIALSETLAATAITHIVVSFDGYGDSGQVENVEAKAGDAIVALPTITIAIGVAVWGKSEPEIRSMALDEAVEHLAYDCLEETHGGWQDGEGAYGAFIFDVAGRSITLDYNGRYIASENHTHEF